MLKNGFFIESFKQIRAADKTTILYLIIISFLILFNYDKVEYAGFWLIAHLIIIIWLWLTPIIDKGIFNKRYVFWNPIVIIFFSFSELHYLVHTIHPVDFDAMLIQIDFSTFGLHPTVWLEKITFPALTEYLQLIYTTFYFLPIILIILLLRQKQDAKADFIIFSVVYAFYLSYAGYFTIPAIGPRFTLDHLQTFQLQGLCLTPGIRLTLDTLENVQRDAFPSGHTAITVMTMFYAYKYNKKYFYILIVIGLSLIFSTVYLRYHYVVDVIAGFVLAGFSLFTAEFVYKLLNRGNAQN